MPRPRAARGPPLRHGMDKDDRPNDSSPSRSREPPRLGRGQRDPARRRPDGPRRRGARRHGPERLRQVARSRTSSPAGRATRSPQGAVLFKGRDLLAMPPEERAREGVFLAFQYPVEIPGVSNVYFLKAAVNAVRKHRGLPEYDAIEFLSLVKQKAKLVEIDEDLVKRPVNEGFSGGEKKRNEIFQMALLEPSPRDPRRDGLGPRHRRPPVVAGGVNQLRSPGAFDARRHALPAAAELHRPRLLHVLVEGRIVRSGGKELALELEEKGYALAREGAARRRRVAMMDAAVAESVFAPRLAPPAGEPAWLAERRSRAFERFERLGFPTPHDEAWRYTGVQPITGTSWAPSAAPASSSLHRPRRESGSDRSPGRSRPRRRASTGSPGPRARPSPLSTRRSSTTRRSSRSCREP